MIKKVIEFIQSDGWLNTIRFILNGIWSALGRKSVTLCLVGKRIDLKISYREYWNQFRIKAYTSSDALESVNVPRLKYTPYHRWFDEGAICRVVFKADIPVAFSWTHYKEHSIGNVGIFDMGDSIAWLGPYFVHKNYRGLSLQQLMINQDVSNASENITSFITSVNQRNTASLHSFLKLNFFIGGCSVFSHGKTTINIKEGVCPYLKIK